MESLVQGLQTRWVPALLKAGAVQNCSCRSLHDEMQEQALTIEKLRKERKHLQDNLNK